ncbi:MBL fold metallo-hydrolase [Aneurinibacillus tyrosinisolvens]|uniref:MBL fold metallo-hydrolase n=1 Tax=Aneurinibacillus tyrosinisolvens TaxID=1443435 RepID=UPI00063F5F33|nr:MBL fold metallo-hydrolase [Aneurinibacillus tyrosinisolvens]
MKHSRIVFFERKFPSANMALVVDEMPILVDTGFGSDAKETVELIREAGISPEDLHLIVNTHYHSDHAGGNYHLQQNYGIPIAAHKWEADAINSRDREACCAEWLDQPVEPYRIDRRLSDGDEIQSGNRVLRVLHTPGHTSGHISLYEPEEKILLCGDLFHRDDMGWINIFREGITSAYKSMDSLDRLAALPIQRAYSGHGSQIENPLVSIDTARNRFEKWRKSPEKISWHACKRIFAYSLIIFDGLPGEEIHGYLLKCAWFQDFARHSFQCEPDEFVPLLLDEMIRSRAAIWQDNRLVATAPYRAPGKQWMKTDIKPKDWPMETVQGAGLTGF